MSGQKFGRLYVICRSDTVNRSDGTKKWKCICDCQKGIIEDERKYTYVTTGNLTNSRTNSCGCLHSESSRIRGYENRKHNLYDLESEEYGIGYTRSGYKFLFSKEDYDTIYQFCWHKHQDGYLRTCCEIKDGKHKYIMMHQLLANKYGFKNEPDHINGLTYDNRKCNLRDTTRSDNMKNTKIYASNTSGVKGVHYNKRQNQWVAYITYEKKRIHLGTFDNKEDAILARKNAEPIYFGDYIRKEMV